MALNVQNADGTVSGANAYISVAYFKSYHSDRGNDYSAFSDPQINGAIIRATDYLDTRFNFIGVKQPNGVKAVGVLTTTGNFSVNDKVLINGQTYKMVTSVATAYDVHIAGTAALSLANLVKAIMGTGTAGSDYGIGTLVNGDVSAVSDSTTLTVTALAGGVDGNDIALTAVSTSASWDGTSLSGGSAQTTEWPRQAGGSDTTFVSVFDGWPTNIFISDAIILLVGPDGGAIKGIPPAVQRATAEYAFRALSIPLFQDAPAPEGGAYYDEHTVKVDVIEETIKYSARQAGAFALPAFPAADMLLVRAGLIAAGRVLTR